MSNVVIGDYNYIVSKRKERESNPHIPGERYTDYKSAALPLSYPSEEKCPTVKWGFFL